MSATTHIRFRGDKKDTWAVSALNQIGPDDQAEIVFRTTNILYDVDWVINGNDAYFIVPPGSVGVDAIGKYLYTFEYNSYHLIIDVTGQDVICATASAGSLSGTRILIVTSESIFVAKTGSNSNDGRPAAPKLTIQAAIDAAVAAGLTHVQVIDSGTYDERLDLKGITVEAASGQTPTILFPFTPFTESASGITAAVRQTAEYTINGTPCLYAAAADGLYRSTDGKNWSKVLLSGHALAGVCVWNNECYVFSNTDKNLYKVSDAGSSSVFASGSTTGLSGSTVNGGLFAIGSLALYISVGDDPVFSVTYDGAWSTQASDDPSYPVQIIYDPEYSLETAFFVGNDLCFGTLSVSTFSQTIYSSVCAKFITLRNGKIYGAFVDSVRVLSSPYTPSIWNEYLSSVAKQSLVQSGVQATGILALFFDDYGYLHVAAEWPGSNITHLISKDNGNTFASSTDVNGMIQSNRQFIRYQGVEIAAQSGGGLLEWDRRHIINTVESSILSGFVVDGSDMAIDSYAGTVSFRHCRVRRHYQPCEDVAVSVAHQHTRFEDMQDSSFRGSSVIDCIIDRCEFARFVGSAVRITGPGVSVEECTIAASGRGLKLHAVPKSVSGCIISGNVVDIDSAVSGVTISQTCFDTKVGLPIVEDQCIIGNPLFIDDTNDLRLKSRAIGYAADSALLDDVDSGSGVDMRESIGARRYSRVLSSSAYGLDYMLHCNPGTVRNAYRPANYDKAYSQNGSMYGRETNPSAHKLARTLSWDSTGGEDAETKAQAAMLRYIYGLDSVFDVGDSTDGTDFVPRRTGSKVSIFIRVSFGATDPLIAPNEHAGALCIDENEIDVGVIGSHTSSYLLFGSYVIDITWTTDPPTSTNILYIDSSKLVQISRVSFGATDPLIAPNEHAGAWCIDEAGTIIGRIGSHTASYLSSGVYVIDITWQNGTDLPTSTSVCKIDAFRRFRIDKTQPFAPVCQMPYVPGIISDIPTQYDITLEEVDE